MDVLNVKTGSCNETHLTSEVIGIKVENVSCVGEEEEEEENDCALHSFPSIKSEHEVRHVCAYMCVTPMTVCPSTSVTRDVKGVLKFPFPYPCSVPLFFTHFGLFCNYLLQCPSYILSPYFIISTFTVPFTSVDISYLFVFIMARTFLLKLLLAC